MKPVWWLLILPEFRDVEIIDLLLQQSGFQIVKGSGLNNADESVAVQKDLNCNGFNSFC